ncbi:GNAT family N-acetyltransferase [Rhodococcus kronopolitis]|uniref:GNAT family N-acetyltransferase n=1 Tax=Rhodococcus kronopolitis TaxID=1460226 RepID=A0ABV9FMP0_9NOCA
MSITVRKSEPADRAAILALMQASTGEHLTPEQRAEQGFVQGVMDEETLTRFMNGPGVFLAEEDGELAGFAMTAEPSPAAGGPVQGTVDAVTAEVPAGTKFFLYGPVAVDARFQGRGVLTKLLTALSRELAGRYALGALFVEESNAKSLAVHRHYGMTEAARFAVGERWYVVFTFEPATFAERTD